MCAKCEEINAKLIRYKRIASQINDKTLQDGLAELQENLRAEKAALHPEPGIE